MPELTEYATSKILGNYNTAIEETFIKVVYFSGIKWRFRTAYQEKYALLQHATSRSGRIYSTHLPQWNHFTVVKAKELTYSMWKGVAFQSTIYVKVAWQA
jgi:hypothetical protein